MVFHFLLLAKFIRDNRVIPIKLIRGMSSTSMCTYFTVVSTEIFGAIDCVNSRTLVFKFTSIVICNCYVPDTSVQLIMLPLM